MTNSEIRAYAKKHGISKQEAKLHFKRTKPKAAKAKVKKLFSIGAFYHGMQDDGISLSFNINDQFPKGHTELLYKNARKTVNAMIKEINSGELTIQWVWDQLKASILVYNQMLYGSEIRPKNDVGPNWRIDLNEPELLRDWVEVTYCILTDIWILTELGEIQNDEYNGMSFSYLS